MSSFKIGSVEIDNILVLAPMAGITDVTFRRICKTFGVGLLYTEMVSAMALTFSNKSTFELLKIDESEHPVSVQIFGSDPKVMAKAAAIVEPYCDLIDINMGCPAPKVVKNGDGSALMTNSSLACDIVKAVVDVVSKPVTVKMRKGVDEKNQNGIEFALRLAKSGASAIAIHARTANQQYSGSADWSFIKQAVDALNVPVIGNGDVKSAQDVISMISETGCKAVMIGRKALGNPWIFSQASAILKGDEEEFPTNEERIALALRHLHMMVEEKGEKTATSDMRKHLAWYIKGMRDATLIRDRINKAEHIKELLVIFSDYLKLLSEESDTKKYVDAKFLCERCE